MADLDHPNCVAVQHALLAAGAVGVVRILPQAAPTAAKAAEQLGVQPGAIANSLIFTSDTGDEVLVMASGAARIDTGRAATALGFLSLVRATPEAVRAATGQSIGGVAPVAHPRPLRTIVDNDLAAFDTVWAAGGVPHAVFPTTFVELLRLTAGTPADVR